MAIDLFCYASQSVEDAQKILDPMIRQHKGLFTERFFICKAFDTNFVQKEIAKENGIVANSGF